MYHLSRNFATHTYDKEITGFELVAKSAVALTCGIVPFAVAFLALMIFRGFATVGSMLEEQAKQTTGIRKIALDSCSTVNAILSLVFAILLTGSAKLFSLSQFIWGHYVQKPSGDGQNTRLAYYGAGVQPWHDLATIARAFFYPTALTEDEWRLEQWRQIVI